MYKTEHLLNQVNGLIKSYEKLAKSTGENFNIFNVMGMETDEVKTHSAIIGQLLNPLGTHSQGDIFLKLFVNYINQKYELGLDNFEELVNEPICERSISKVDLLNSIGGRIDIIIEDKNQILIIENKPGWGDQPMQLIRYNNYAKKKNKKFHILYLTLEGREVNNEEHIIGEIEIKGDYYSIKDKTQYDKFDSNKDSKNCCLYCPISFEVDIKNWIEKCLEKSASLPLVRETLIQYLFLIKKLTNQSTNNAMSNDIRNLISEDNIESIVLINNELNGIIRNTKAKFLESLNEHFKKKNINVGENCIIKTYVTDDSDGLFIGYQYFENNEPKNSEEKAQFFYKIMYNINSQSQRATKNYFSWYNPSIFSKRKKFENYEKKEILKMHTSEIYLKEFVSKIIDEENEIREHFLEKIKNESPHKMGVLETEQNTQQINSLKK